MQLCTCEIENYCRADKHSISRGCSSECNELLNKMSAERSSTETGTNRRDVHHTTVSKTFVTLSMDKFRTFKVLRETEEDVGLSAQPAILEICRQKKLRMSYWSESFQNG